VGTPCIIEFEANRLSSNSIIQGVSKGFSTSGYSAFPHITLSGLGPLESVISRFYEVVFFFEYDRMTEYAKHGCINGLY